MYQIKINSTTGSEIISTADVKSYARIDTTADDTLIGQMITQARIVLENYISRDIVAKNRTFYRSHVDQRFEVPFAPVTTISSITVESTTAAHTVYGLDKSVIELDELPAKDMEMVYITTGLSDSAIKEALLQFVTTLYENRVDFIEGKTIQKIPTSSKELLSSYKALFI
tara:strand:+ start:4313 stop:4822 length:510 start_codon:yes stop_codon:yes gene_type:complete